MTLSVLIPVYNTGDWLPRCLESLLAQDRLPDEILLVDDGSDDGLTGALCDDYARRHPGLIRAIHTRNRGVGAARNTCVEEARGDYLLFVDSDDHVSPRLVSTLYPYMERGIDAAVFSFLIDYDGRILKPAYEALPAGAVTTLRESPALWFASPGPWNKLWRRSLFLDNGIRFPTGILFEDLATTPRLLAQAEQIAVIGEALYYYTERKGSIMRAGDPKRDRDIMTAFDCLTDWFRKTGSYPLFREELEALAVEHVLLAASVRVAKADPESPVLQELEDYLQKGFPAWQSNPYVKKLSLRQRLVLRLLRKRRYRLVRSLFRMRDRQKAGAIGDHERNERNK